MNSEERAAREAAKQRKAEALGALLRILRGYRGVSQTVLARRAGVPRQLLSGLEAGRRLRPEPATLEKLAAALGVRPAQLRRQETIPELVALLAPAGAGELPAVEPRGEPAPPAPPEPVAAGDYVTSLGLLPALPPGTTLIQRRNPDGSTEVYLHVPRPGEPDDDGDDGDNGDNADATSGG